MSGSDEQLGLGVSRVPDTQGAYLNTWFLFCAIVFVSGMLSGAVAIFSIFVIVFMTLAAFQLLGMYAALGSEAYHWRILKSFIAMVLYLSAVLVGLLPSLLAANGADVLGMIKIVLWVVAHQVFVTQTLLFALRAIFGLQFHFHDQNRSSGFRITDLMLLTFCLALSFSVFERCLPHQMMEHRRESKFQLSMYPLLFFFTVHVISGLVPLLVIFRASTTESGCLGLFCGMFFLMLGHISFSGVVFTLVGDTNLAGFLWVTVAGGVTAMITSAITATVLSALREKGFVLSSYKTK